MKRKRVKVILLVIGIIAFIIVGINFDKIFGNYHDKFLVAEGSLSLEESTEGYVLREEIVLQNDEPDNGMVQIVPDGEKAAKNEAVYRYYSDSEDRILEEISNLDIQISDEIEQNGSNLISSDISSIERQIESTINEMYKINDVKKTNEYRAELDSYMTKKAQITGEISASDSRIRQLTNQRNDLQKQLEAESKIVYAPESGVVSYRVDGLEETLKVDDFSYLTTDLLEDYDLKVGVAVPLSQNQAKLINNFNSYIVVSMNTEMASAAAVNDNVTLRLPNLKEIKAEVVYVKNDEGNYIIVFKVDRDIDYLIQYRKISLDVIWWKYSGWKISNSALINENDIMYVEKQKNGFIDKIPVKILRQNESYSIVENYTDDELAELGFKESEISGRVKVKLYDEILLH